jgi:hypothetical protein
MVGDCDVFGVVYCVVYCVVRGLLINRVIIVYVADNRVGSVELCVGANCRPSTRLS